MTKIQLSCVSEAHVLRTPTTVVYFIIEKYLSQSKILRSEFYLLLKKILLKLSVQSEKLIFYFKLL